MNCARCIDPDANHTTAQHDLAIEDANLCVECGEHERVNGDPEARLCPSCWAAEGEYLSELASYYHPDEGGSE